MSNSRLLALLALTAGLAATPLLAQMPAKPAAPGTQTYAPAARLIDINTATKAELDSLPGIGAARSDAIIKGRPYKSKDELVRRSIVPQNVYDTIKDRIVAKQA